jgi:hypothetical protein
MSDKVVQIRPDRKPLGHYIRIGSTGHNLLEEGLAGNRVHIERAVFDAAVVRSQASLRDALRDAGAELILDTNVAELSSIGRYEGVARNCPWAVAGRPLAASDFEGSSGNERLLKIAQCAVENKFRTILAPTHLLTGPDDPNFALDVRICSELRSALDASGGAAISIDYPLLISMTSLRDDRERSAYIAALWSLPFDNLWLRIGDFGASATPIGVRRYIEAAQDFQQLQRPLLGDNIAGLNALAALAFGAVGGIAHGIGIGETFNNGTWKRPPTKRDQKGGAGTRILVPLLDRHLKPAQLKAIMDANGGRRMASCHDPICCKRGYDDMVADPRGHNLRTRNAQVLALSRVPDFGRAGHFLSEDLSKAERTSAMMGRLKIADLETKELILDETDRLHRLHVVLEALQGQGVDQRRSLVPAPRGSRAPRASRMSR